MRGPIQIKIHSPIRREPNMATTKKTQSTTSTATATATAAQATNKKETPAMETIQLKPYKNFLMIPGKQLTYIATDGTLNPQFEKEEVNKDLNIYKVTDIPLISKSYQTFWTDSQNNIYNIQFQIAATSTSINDKGETITKTFSPVKNAIRTLFSQLGLTTYNKLETPEDIIQHFKIIKQDYNYTFTIVKSDNHTYYQPTFINNKPINHEPEFTF